LTKPNRRSGHELPKVKGGLSESQHSFLHLMDHASHGAKSTLHPCASLHPRVKRVSSFPSFHPKARKMPPSPSHHPRVMIKASPPSLI